MGLFEKYDCHLKNTIIAKRIITESIENSLNIIL